MRVVAFSNFTLLFSRRKVLWILKFSWIWTAQICSNIYQYPYWVKIFLEIFVSFLKRKCYVCLFKSRGRCKFWLNGRRKSEKCRHFSLWFWYECLYLEFLLRNLNTKFLPTFILCFHQKKKNKIPFAYCISLLFCACLGYS